MKEITNPPVLAVIIPCFNEEMIVRQSHEMITAELSALIHSGKISDNSFVCFVDDGSIDSTWCIIEELADNGTTRGIKLSTNFGHQNALLAGLLTFKDKADCFLTMDADMQDDISVLKEMLTCYSKGNKIIYGIRDSRLSDSVLKRGTARLYYSIMKLLGVKVLKDHADFRLADSEVINKLEQYKEVNLFLRGIFPLMGYKSEVVLYSRKKRIGGSTKYTPAKMVGFAWQGITSFNTSLLRMVTVFGMIMFILAIITAVWALVSHFRGLTIRGWTSILLIISAFSGINMISLGLIGEYVGKIYLEVKQRPRYLIEKSV